MSLGSNEQIFTPDELDENEQKKAALNKLLLSGEGILMVGAGCSASTFPTWGKLMDLFYERSCRKKKGFSPFDPAKEDILDFADRVKKWIGDEDYYNFIDQKFKEKGHPYEKYHETLCKLLSLKKLRGITTTNYDKILDQALVSVTKNYAEPIYIDPDIEPARIFEYLLSFSDNEIPMRIFHIHGVYDKRQSIILSKSEYQEKYGFKLFKPPDEIYKAIMQGNISEMGFSDLLGSYGVRWTLHYKILWSLFATRRLIFLGFSLTDPYFNKMLEFVSKDLHPNGYMQHFLILRISKQEEKEAAKTKATELKESYGIETIFFEDDENKKGLENFIFEMEKTINNQDVSAKEDKIMSPANNLDGNEELTKNLIQHFKAKL